MAPSKTAKLTGSAPVLFVRDVYAATKHYRDAMGFSFGKIWGEPPSFAILKRDDMYVMVKQIKDHKYIVPRSTVYAGLWDMYFWVDDVDALYKECPLCACPLPGHSLPTHSVPAPTTAIRYRPFKAYVRIDAKCQ